MIEIQFPILNFTFIQSISRNSVIWGSNLDNNEKGGLHPSHRNVKFENNFRKNKKYTCKRGTKS